MLLRKKLVRLSGVAVLAGLMIAARAGAAETAEQIVLDPAWEFAGYSVINTGSAALYHAPAEAARGVTVCVNAGHGTAGGAAVYTLSHPDGSAKLVSGTTQAGATQSIAISAGTTLLDGTSEAAANLSLAMLLKEKLLDNGYDVLMIRETDDVQLDNIARTVIANNTADCHIALHYDSTQNNKGIFFLTPPNVDAYLNMYPVSLHWQEHTALGRTLISGLQSVGAGIYGNGEMEMDLTQTSYSTIPSIDLEVGDTASDHSEYTQGIIADGIVAGLNTFFSESAAEPEKPGSRENF